MRRFLTHPLNSLTSKMKNLNSKLPVKKYTPEEAKSFVLSSCTAGKNLTTQLKHLAEVLIPKLENGTEKEKKDAEKEILENAMSILRANEDESCIALMESVSENYRDLAKELSKQIRSDYGCTTSIEKALARDIVSAHIRVIDNSRRLNNELECREINQNRTYYIATLSKQLDRAHRQFINSVALLKQLKAPAIEMSIRANTAFVSNNQQINVEEKNHENIEAI
jgi:hypothetical protein